MKKRRTRHFKFTLSTVGIASAIFLAWLLLFGRGMAQTHFQGIADTVFAVMALATGSFLVFSFFPYFRGDKRWYSISVLLTIVFFAGTAMLFSTPWTGGIGI